MADPLSSVIQAALGKLLDGLGAKAVAVERGDDRPEIAPAVPHIVRKAGSDALLADEAGGAAATAPPTWSAASLEALHAFVVAAAAGDRTAAAGHARTVLKKTTLTAGTPLGMAASLSRWLGDGAPNGDVLRALARKGYRVLQTENTAAARAAAALPAAKTEPTSGT